MCRIGNSGFIAASRFSRFANFLRRYMTPVALTHPVPAPYCKFPEHKFAAKNPAQAMRPGILWHSRPHLIL